MKRIAIVDDSSFDLELMSNHLKKSNFSVTCYTSGNKLLEEIELNQFDLIILDILMPEINGLEVLQQLRLKFDQMNLPVVMLSALDDYDYVEESVSFGANEFMVKPLDLRLFDLRLKTHLDLKEQFHKTKEVERQRQTRLIVEQYHHELLNPLTIAMNALDDIDHEFKHSNVDIIKQAHARLEETIRKIYQAYKQDLE
jgi:two-component system, sensor histidine kinase ChiS